jgi:DNA recombination-dependent growth factor C
MLVLEWGVCSSYTQQFDQDFAIMSLEIAKFMKSLSAAFGGIGCVGDDS